MKLLLIGLLFIGFNCMAQQPTQRVFRATEKLQTDDKMIYQNKDIPLLDVTYTQYSSDSTNWHNGFTVGDKYIRFSNDLKVTWSKTKLLGGALTHSDSLTVFVTPTQLHDSIGSISVNTDSLVHKGRTETITGAKTFTSDINGVGFIGQSSILTKNTSGNVLSVTNTNGNDQGMGIQSTSPYVGVEGIGTGTYGYGISGISGNIPIQGANASTSGTGVKRVFVLRGNSINLTPENDYGLSIDWQLPVLGWENPAYSDKLGARMSAVVTDITQDSEDSRFEWSLISGGEVTKKMTLSSDGKLTPDHYGFTARASAPSSPSDGDMYYSTDGVIYFYSNSTWNPMAGEPNLARGYSIKLPSSASVAGRCSGAVEGTDYPTGWTIGAWSGNSHDIEITHNLNKTITGVTVYSTSASGDRLLIGTASFTGVLATSKNVLRIEGLATVGTPIIINLIFK